MAITKRFIEILLLSGGAVLLSGCGTFSAMNNLADGAGTESMRMWDRWVDSKGDIAVATTWERKVKPGVTIAQIEMALASISAEENMRSVGELPLSKELEARSGKKEKFLKVYSYCTPATARRRNVIRSSAISSLRTIPSTRSTNAAAPWLSTR